MNVNSEAIYASRPIAPYKEGKVALTQNRHSKAVYAIYLPSAEEHTLPSKMWLTTIQPEQGASVQGASVKMLGIPGNLEWESVNEGFVVTIPDQIQNAGLPIEAWVLKISSVKTQ